MNNVLVGSIISSRPRRVELGAAWATILLAGAIFGFFFAWVCSTMWGLDDADPRVAIAAMQAMNASVRNAVFFPAFFLTPVVALVTAGFALAVGSRRAATMFALAALVYGLGGLAVTLAVSVPMNEALAAVDVPTDRAAAGEVWREYSPRWQAYNQARTVASGLALLLCAAGLTALAGGRGRPG
ncbi:DUF1772 domain-containing protein [Tsukamurella sp. M9C]|uniref:anthrone oxygenase family protein n=1 Tax=unclassified Tsukamurella TaxID=2633480 RepID=UPI001CD00D7B|nr:anthrone oxygenase family protein [Tsukamurella sp. M9C]MCA0156587.1 DUF1772 domain-containing protein [Tsukamurella sp. M9C]